MALQFENGVNPSEEAGGGVEKEVDFGSWSVRDLRQFLEDRGIDTSTATEKEELVSRVTAVALLPTPPCDTERECNGYNSLHPSFFDSRNKRAGRQAGGREGGTMSGFL